MSRVMAAADPRILCATFQHAQGIGVTTEQRLWNQGVLHWNDFLENRPASIGHAKYALAQETVRGSIEALERRDARWFARHLAASEHWRLLPWFGTNIAYLDIETNGGTEADDITIIGVYDGFEPRILVAGRDLETFPEIIKEADLLVTFFGNGFDLPFLRRRFPDLDLDLPHIDLCPTLRKLGQRGGLKAIEGRLGIWRDDSVDGLTGWDAVRLWEQWRRHGDHDCLDLLIRYNRDDIVHLEALLSWALPRLIAQSGFPRAVE